jgi:hypothetical protein
VSMIPRLSIAWLEGIGNVWCLRAWLFVGCARFVGEVLLVWKVTGSRMGMELELEMALNFLIGQARDN